MNERRSGGLVPACLPAVCFAADMDGESGVLASDGRAGICRRRRATPAGPTMGAPLRAVWLARNVRCRPMETGEKSEH